MCRAYRLLSLGCIESHILPNLALWVSNMFQPVLQSRELLWILGGFLVVLTLVVLTLVALITYLMP